MAEIEMEDDVSLRDKTLSIAKIDEEFMSNHIRQLIDKHTTDHSEFHEQRVEWLSAYRDFQYQKHQGPFDNSSDFHSPLMMTYAKATHARLYQIFGQQMAFFAVEANNSSFLEKEDIVRRFMNWVLGKWINRGQGAKDIFDEWLLDVVVEGTGILKLSWDRYSHTYTDVVEEVDIEEQVQFNADTFTSDILKKVRFKEVNKEKTEEKQAPKLTKVNLEDFFMPIGFKSAQDAPWVANRVYMTDEDLKRRAMDEKFDPDKVEECIIHRTNRFQSTNASQNLNQAREVVSSLEGTQIYNSTVDEIVYNNENHSVIEWYGKAYVEKTIDQDVFDDTSKLPREVIIWLHEATGKVLGWTELHRVCASGRRPFYVSTFIPSISRAYGIGVCELLYPTNNYIDAVHNLKMDNGMLASLQFGFFRAGGTIKPDVMRINPGELRPLEDVNDVKFVNFPYLGNFGATEEANLKQEARELLAISEMQLGQAPAQVGALRNATGANLLSRESQIQLSIHFDRLARSLNALLRDLFILCREKMPDSLVFRVTGEDGRPIFGNVSREDLKGDFDFDISVDLLAASELEKQQRATLLWQTQNNPTLLQLGIVTPENLYAGMKNLLRVNGVKRVDEMITKPQGYQGPKLTPTERIMRIVTQNYNDPPIEQSIRMDEDHQEALRIYQNFKDSDMYGMFVNNDQIAAFEMLVKETEGMLMAQQGALVANRAGVQVSPDSLQGMPAQNMQPGAPMDQGPMMSQQMGEARGPVV